MFWTMNFAIYYIFLQMSPPDNLQSEALAAVVAHFRWTSMAIIVEKSSYGKDMIPLYFKTAMYLAYTELHKSMPVINKMI